MTEAISSLESKIRQFEKLLREMKDVTRESHVLLKDIRNERKHIEKLLTNEVKKMIDDRVGELLEKELERIGPEVREQTHLIYDRVGQQIDKLITLTLGKEYALKKGNEDLRPLLAAKLRVWVREIISDEVILSNHECKKEIISDINQ